MSYQYFKENPHLKKTFRASETCGKAINGSKVLSVGEVDLKFRVEGVHMQVNCKVIKGLMDPIVLGWDWMFKYKVMLDPSNGKMHFMGGKTTPLIENSHFVTGCYYKVFEDLTVPPNSKMHTEVELMLDKQHANRATTTVITEPFSNNGSDVWSCRTCSTVKDGKFMTEFINCCDYSVKLEAGRVLGYAEFTQDDDVQQAAVQTEMNCSFKGDDSAYESGDDTEVKAQANEEDDEDLDEIVCDKPPKQVPKEPPDTVPLGGCPLPGPVPPQPPTCSAHRSDAIPPGAKPLKVDYSKMARDAEPYSERLKELLEVKHEKAFSKHDRDYGKTSLVQYRAHLKDRDATPIAVPPYRTRPEMREVIDKQAYEMIADGLVSHSTSAYSAPILLARKKCGGWRFLTDFRKVNERCNKVVYPLPRIEDSIQKLDNPRYFSSMDLTKGFWQVPIHPADRKYFAFSTESMHLEYLVAPMGAKNSPAYLGALMQLVLRGLPAQHVICYLDDILVADNNMEDHLHHLDQVLTALEKAGLKLNPSKCAFAQESVICLGHLLSREGIAPDPANVAKIKSWKIPKSVKQLRGFLGLTGYYRHWVRMYSEIAKSLTDLTREDMKWQWMKEHQIAFEALRDALTENTIMNYPDFSKPFIIKADASLSAIGYVLTQKVDGKERPISFGSKKLSRPQQRWCTYDREFFALIAAVRANAHYLRHAKFTAITDHRPLLAWRKVDAQKDPTGRRTRWSIELDNYEFDLIFKKGKMHCDADAMSRRGDDDDEIAEDSDEFCFHSEGDEGYFSFEEGDLCFLGMAEEDEHSIAKFNSERGPIRRLRRKQDADTVLAEVKCFVKSRKRLPRAFPDAWFQRNSRWLTMRDGILYRKSYSDVVDAPVLQAIIPESMVQEVLADLHGSEWAGHPSANKMQLKVQRYAIWPTMSRDIREAVKDCSICDQVREQVPKPVTPLQPIVAKRVFDHVMCDLISFPVVSFGFKYVLVFKDVFSGYVKFYRLRNKTTDGVVKAFEDLTCSLGPPKLLTSDNGGEFVSEALELACKVKGVEKRTSVAYRPQSQGNVERQNRILIQDLQKRLIQYGKTWVEHLPYVEWLHNTTPFAKTRMSPFFLFFGREPYTPPFADVEDGDIKDINNRRYLKKLRARMESIYEEANRRAEEKRAKEAESYNKKVKHVPFEKGEEAWEKVNVRHKLNPKWSGPLRVMERRASSSGGPGTTYVCQRRDGAIVQRNYEQLKRALAKAKELKQDLGEKIQAKEKEIRSEREEADTLSVLAAVFAAQTDDDLAVPQVASPGRPPGPVLAVPVPSPPVAMLKAPSAPGEAVQHRPALPESGPVLLGAAGADLPEVGWANDALFSTGPFLLTPAAVVVRPTTPPHPLFGELDSSTEFQTPSPPLLAPRAPEAPVPNVLQDASLMQLTGTSGLLATRKKRVRRSVELLPVDDGSSEEEAFVPAQQELKPVGPAFAARDTVPYARSETDEQGEEPAPVKEDEQDGLFRVQVGNPAITLSTVGPTMRPNPGTGSIQSIVLEGPSQDFLALTRSENRELQTKMKAKDSRPRAHSTEPGYARPSLAGAQKRDKAQRLGEAEPLVGSMGRRHTTRRPNGGRFAKKTASSKTKNLPTEERSDEEHPTSL